jgi:plastocyanin
MRKRLVAATVVLAAALALAACGGDDNDGSDGTNQPAVAGQTLTLTADSGGALKFDKDTLSANAGKVTIMLENPSDVPHAIEVEGNGIEEEGETASKGGRSAVTADLKAGTYEYYCPVGNHKDEGMEGELTVK